MRIEDEIRQKSFASEYHKAHINLLFTSAWAGLQATQWLKPFNISMQQFNLLRILRGVHPEPANIRELTERMLDKTSNTSRLVDKLLKKKLVSKTMSPEDLRQVRITITDTGLALLLEASSVVEKGIDSIFSNLETGEASLISDLLDKLRG